MKVVSKFLAVVTLVLLATGSSFAQQKDKLSPEQREKIEQLKKDFITKELELTEEQEKKFWPIYDNMSADIRKVKKSEKEAMKDLKTNFESLSDKDVESKMATIFAAQEKEIAIKREYNQKFSALIGAKKAAKLLSLEQRFKRELLQRMNGENGPHGPKGPKGPKPPIEE